MGGFTQPDGTVVEIFGTGGGADVASRLGTEVLGSIPLSIALREGGDSGVPVVLAHPEDAASVAIIAIATQLATRARGLAGKKLGVSPRG